MKHIQRTIWPLSLILAITTCTSQATTNLVIEYRHAGLDEISVSNGQLRVYWTSTRRDVDPEQAGYSASGQSMEAYDTHVDTIGLAPREVTEFRDWCATFDIFDMPREYPTNPIPTYGSAFESSLHVVLDTNHFDVAWTGGSNIPEGFVSAIKAINALANRIVRSRR